MQAGTREYELFYQKHPELKEVDDKKREKGGSLGRPGSIDSPFEKSNVAVMASLQSFGFQMADKDIITPGQTHLLKGVQEVMDPATASEKIKGFSKHLGGSLVGITKVDPRWVYSHRGMGKLQKKQLKLKTIPVRSNFTCQAKQ